MIQLKIKLATYLSSLGSNLTKEETCEAILKFINNNFLLILEETNLDEFNSFAKDAFFEGYKLGTNQGEDYEVYSNYFKSTDDYVKNLKLTDYFVNHE